MKQTWITKAMIALMTLALVAGVFVIAPREAQAAGDFKLSGPVTVSKGGSGHYVMAIPATVTTAFYFFTDDAADNATVVNNRDITTAFAASGQKTIECRVYSDEAKTSEIGSDSITVTVTEAPSITGGGNITGTVGTAITSVAFSASGYPTNMTWSINPALPNGLTLSNGTISGTPTAVAASATYTVTASNGVAPDASKQLTIAIGKGTATLSGSVSPTTGVAPNEPITLTATTPSDGAITWYKSVNSATAVELGTSAAGVKTYTYTPSSGEAGTSIAFTATQAESTNYSAVATAASLGTSAISQARTSITINRPSNGATVAPGTIYLDATVTPTTTVKWTQTNGYNTIANDTSPIATYAVSNNDIGKTLTFTITAAASGTSSASSKSVSVTVSNDASVTQPSSNTTVTLSKVNDVTSQTVTSSNGTDLVVRNTNTNAVTVRYNGAEITTGTTVPSGQSLSITAKTANTRSTIEITPVNGGTTRTLTAYVGSVTPTISEVQFWSSADNSNTLTKVSNWGTLKVTVQNYNKSYPYVTIRRNNVRTYVQGNYTSHANTYDYTVQLTAINDYDATATVYIIPQYNGSTHYTVSHTGATSVNSPTIYVSGYPALPQTGPDYTLAYVLGGLCLVSAVTAVTLNVRKKKQKKQDA